MWGHLSLTLLQQSHLCPLPLLQQPIYWQYDHALHLYPLPHAVVVAEASAPQAQYEHMGCTVFNPGSFTEHGCFAAFVPCKQVGCGGGSSSGLGWHAVGRAKLGALLLGAWGSEVQPA